MSITYGKFTVDPTTLPPKSLEALLSRGLTHYLGNEQNSKVSTKAKKDAEAGNPWADDEKAKALADAQEEAFVALVAGTVGTRVGGPRLDPYEKALRDIAGEEVAEMLRKAGHKVPKGKEIVTVKGQALTFADLVARRVGDERHSDRLAKAAKARVAEIERRAKGVAEESIDDLI